MNLSFSFVRFALACTLIVALSASTARSQFYDPLGVQNKSKPFGKYGPTFQYTSPTKVMNALNGRSNHQPNHRIARRVAPSRVERLNDLNLSVSMPSGPWAKVDQKENGKAARYMISRKSPTIIISLAGERAGAETPHTDRALVAASQAKVKSMGATLEPGEQQLSAGAINGFAFSATVVDGASKTYYAVWVAAHNGYNYQLAVYGNEHDKTMIDMALRNFVRGIKPAPPTTVAHRNSHTKATTR